MRLGVYCAAACIRRTSTVRSASSPSQQVLRSGLQFGAGAEPMRRWYAIRRALASTPAADQRLRKAVRRASKELTPQARDVGTLRRTLTGPGDDLVGQQLAQEFLRRLHDEFTRFTVVSWERPMSLSVETPVSDIDDGHVGQGPALASVRESIARGRSSVVRGAPGIGKTTLLSQLQSGFPHAIFVRLEQGGEPLRDLRLGLHRAVGGDFPVDDDQGIAVLARAFAEGGLIFVDNADEPSSAQAVARLASHIPALTFVVTSRGQEFSGFEVIELRPLSDAQAEQLLEQLELEPDQRPTVIARAAGNPLLLRQEAWAVGKGNAEAGQDRLGDIVSQFRGAEMRAIWLIGELPSAVLPGPLLSGVGHLTPSSLRMLEQNAVAKPASYGFEFHQTLRVACQQALESASFVELETLRRDAAAFYTDWLTQRPSLEIIDRALPDLLHLMSRCDDAGARVSLALALIGDHLDDPNGYIPSRGLAGLMREQRVPLQEAASVVGGIDAAKLEKNLGLFCHWGDDPKAEELVLSARARFRAASDEVGIAGATWVLGIIADDSCQFSDAEALYREPLLWLTDLAVRAVGNHLVGCTLYHQGRYEAARAAFEEALATTEDPVLLSRIGRRLAYVELLSGDPQSAIDALEVIKDRAHALARPRDVARTMRHIGQAQLMLGDVDAAERSFAAALQGFERVGDRRGQGATLLGLASTKRLQQSYHEAKELALESARIAQGGDSLLDGRLLSPLGVARADEELARIAEVLGDEVGSVTHLRRSCNVYEAIGHARGPQLAAELGPRRDGRYPKPKGVLIDLINTLAVTRQGEYEDAKRSMSQRLGIDHDRFKAAWGRSRARASTDSDWSPRDRIAWVASQLRVPVPDDLLDELADGERELWSTGVFLKPEAAEVLERIAAGGIAIALVSNGTSAMAGLPSALGIERSLSATVISCDVGVLKPRAGIYRRALTELGLKAADCVYVGDGSDRELEGAKAVGLFAVRIVADPKPEFGSKDSLDWDATASSLSDLAERLTT